MNHTLRSKIFVLTLNLSLSAVLLSCGSTADTSPVTTEASTATTTTSGTTSSSSLAITGSASSVVIGGTLQFSATGGTPTYTYFASAGTINGSGLFTAPETAETVTVYVNDLAGNTASATVTVTTSSGSGSLTLTPSATSITPGQTVTFTASGGSGTYDYWIVTGAGTLSGTSGTSTTYYSSTSDTGSIEVAVHDYSSPELNAYSSVTVTSSGSTSFYDNLQIITDDMLGITFYNTSAMTYPQLVFFGTGSKPNEPSMFAHTSVGSCGYDGLGDTKSPCTQFISLNNFPNSTPTTTTYEGTITFTGRSGWR